MNIILLITLRRTCRDYDLEVSLAAPYFPLHLVFRTVITACRGKWALHHLRFASLGEHK
jgi:hypothetical protein